MVLLSFTKVYSIVKNVSGTVASFVSFTFSYPIAAFCQCKYRKRWPAGVPGRDVTSSPWRKWRLWRAQWISDRRPGPWAWFFFLYGIVGIMTASHLQRVWCGSKSTQPLRCGIVRPIAALSVTSGINASAVCTPRETATQDGLAPRIYFGCRAVFYIPREVWYCLVMLVTKRDRWESTSQGRVMCEHY